MRCLYVDLDGTLLGQNASLLHDGEGVLSLLGVRAIEACVRAGVEVVLTSGRRQAQVAEDARLLGQSSYIYESGAALVLDGEELWLTGDLVPSERSIHDQITDSGAPALLLEHYAGRLEYHAPWHVNREVSHLFRGLIEVAEAESLLAGSGLGHLRLVDNGVLKSRSAQLAALPLVRAYHLLPALASKPAAVARHMRARGLTAPDTMAVGDSREDLMMATVVGSFWLVANGRQRDPEIADLLPAYPNARVCEQSNGAGVYEAVITTLVAR